MTSAFQRPLTIPLQKPLKGRLINPLRGVVTEGGVVPPNQLKSRADGTAIKSRIDETPLQSRAA